MYGSNIAEGGGKYPPNAAPEEKSPVLLGLTLIIFGSRHDIKNMTKISVSTLLKTPR